MDKIDSEYMQELIEEAGWPMTVKDGVWIFEKTPRCVLVCEGEPFVDWRYRDRYLKWPKMVEIFIQEEWDDETLTLGMKQEKWEDTPYHYIVRVYFRDTLARHDSRVRTDERYLSKKAREMGEKYLWNYVYEQFPAMQVMMMKNGYYDQMIKASFDTGYPESFDEDLYKIDMERLARNEPNMFAWVLYRQGTNLCLTAGEADYFIRYRMANCDDAKYYRAFNGLLTQMSQDELLSWAKTHLPTGD